MVSQPDVKAEELPAAIRATDPHILIVRGKKVSADALKAGTALTLVIRAGAGIDTIDVNTASSLGVFVSNCPGKNSIAVAELVMGLLLACDRRIPDQVAELRAGRLEQGRVLQGARAARADARHRRAGADRAGDRGAGAGVRDAGDRLVAGA